MDELTPYQIECRKIAKTGAIAVEFRTVAECPKDATQRVRSLTVDRAWREVNRYVEKMQIQLSLHVSAGEWSERQGRAIYEAKALYLSHSSEEETNQEVDRVS